MSHFSFTKADYYNTKVANITEGSPFKLLIPKEFGGGYIKDYYQGYGRVGHKEDNSPKYDVYELLFQWNISNLPSIIKEKFRNHPTDNSLKEIDESTKCNRSLGIDLFYDKEIPVTHPLKFVSVSYKGTYEECKGISYDDPNQGLVKLSWENWEKFKTEEGLQ